MAPIYKKRLTALAVSDQGPLCLSTPERGLFVSLGGWGEGEIKARGIAHHVLSYYYYYYYYYYFYYYYYYIRYTSVIAMDFLSQNPSPNHGFWEAKRVST